MDNRVAIRVGMNQLVRPESQTASRLSFQAFYLFTLLLYLRPQEMFPSLFEGFPIAKAAAILALGGYVISRVRRGEQLTSWTIELKMILLIAALGLLFAPFAASPGDSLKELSDVFLKVVVVFALMISLIDTEARLNSILRLVVIISAFMAVAAIRSYLIGEFTPKTTRIFGVVSGLFGNPNDLATSLDLVIPFAVILALMSSGVKRLFFAACTLVLTAGMVVTFSRGGFLGFLALSTFLVWKLGRLRRTTAVGLVVAATLLFLIAVPASYSGRLSSILHPNADITGSAEARLNLLTRATELALTHPMVGLGLANFHIYSIQEQRAHNSYLEISAELGLVGLIAYLIILFGPFRYLRRIEKESSIQNSEEVRVSSAWQNRFAKSQSGGPGNRYYLSVAVQAALLSYAVCSFFGSIQYMWDLYYIVAYAVALKGISASKRVEETEGVRLEQPVRGLLWSTSR